MSTLTKKNCKNLRKYNNDGTFNQLYIKLQDRNWVDSHMNLYCMVKGYSSQKIENIGFPLIRQCPTAVYNLINILKLTEKNKLNVIKRTNKKEKTISLLFHYIDNEIKAKLYAYLTDCIRNLYKSDKLKTLTVFFALNLLRGDKWIDIKGKYLHAYIYDRSIIPLPAAVKKETNKHIKLMIRTCTGDKIPYAYKEEYKMRYKIAKKMTNNFEQFNIAIKDYKVKAEKMIKNYEKSDEFVIYCKKHHSIPFKLNFLQLLKETDQGYLITPELKKHLR